jgi:predicted Zn-dependent protease
MIRKSLFSGRVARSVLTVGAIMAMAAPFMLPTAHAQGAPTVIRDSEIEAILQDWTSPLVAAAGLEPGSVNFIIVQDSDINAFVAGGANIFIYTGLIEKTKNPGELIGVIAHELGHIRGGHLIRTREAMENASYESILGMVLGVGAAILSGDGGAAAAVSTGAQAQAMRRFLSFSRAQESSADQSALDEFNQAQMNPEGFMSFMQTLESQELLPASQQSAYMRSHPMTRDRIAAIESGVNKSPYKNKPLPAEWDEQHARFLAKLIGFISPGKVAWEYDDRDQSLHARYARTIAAYRESRVDQSLKMMDQLLAEEPNNPYFHELKGQMLMDYGRLDAAETSLRRAVELAPKAPLIRILYAHTLIENSRNGQNKADVTEAISQLNRAQRDESRSPRIHRLLATAYGYLGQESEAQLHLAEEAVLQRRYKDAKRLAQTASGAMKHGSRSWLRAQDILSYISTVEKNKDKDG